MAFISAPYFYWGRGRRNEGFRQVGSSGEYAAAFNNKHKRCTKCSDVTFDFRYYVPSSNTGADSIIPIFDNVSGTAALDVTLDSWNTYSDIITTAADCY